MYHVYIHIYLSHASRPDKKENAPEKHLTAAVGLGTKFKIQRTPPPLYIPIYIYAHTHEHTAVIYNTHNTHAHTSYNIRFSS